MDASRIDTSGLIIMPYAGVGIKKLAYVNSSVAVRNATIYGIIILTVFESRTVSKQTYTSETRTESQCQITLEALPRQPNPCFAEKVNNSNKWQERERYTQSESSPEHLNDFAPAYIVFSNLYNSALISQDNFRRTLHWDGWGGQVGARPWTLDTLYTMEGLAMT